MDVDRGMREAGIREVGHECGGHESACNGQA